MNEVTSSINSSVYQSLKTPGSYMQLQSQFYASYQHQHFPLPDTMIYYITMNPSTSTVYRKMVKSCKYFFIKNPIFVINSLDWCDEGWRIWIEQTRRTVNMNRMLCKFWILGSIIFDTNTFAIEKNVLSEIIHKIYKFDGNYLHLGNQIISLNDLVFLLSNNLRYFEVKEDIKDSNGNVITFEKIVEILPTLKSFWFTASSKSITAETWKNVLKIPKFLNHEFLGLHNIPEAFDLDTFYTYMKKNKHTRMQLYFSVSISEVYKNRLLKIIDEIIAAKEHDYNIPWIYFEEIDDERYSEIYDLYTRST